MQWVYLTYFINSRLDIIWGPLVDNITIFPFHLQGCIHVIFTLNPRSYLILIVEVRGLSPSAVVFWYDADTLEQLFIFLKSLTSIFKPNKFTIEQTLIAARWIVWGIQRMRDFLAENSMPASWHRDSIASIMVSLLLALSIMIAMI